jgi:hypothetical protein
VRTFKLQVQTTGAGMPVFANVDACQQLRLVAARPFDCGITALHFEPKRS